MPTYPCSLGPHPQTLDSLIALLVRSPRLVLITRFQWRAEAVGCPGPTRFLDALENIFYSSCKISDDLFLVFHLNVSLFRISCQISREFAPWMPPPVLHHAPVTTFFTCFWSFSYIFKKTGPWDAHQGGFPGPSHRPHPTLHATD